MRWFFSFYALLNFLEHCSWISSVSFFNGFSGFHVPASENSSTPAHGVFFLCVARRKGTTIITFQYPILQRQLQFSSRFRVTESIEFPRINDHLKRLETLESGRDPGERNSADVLFLCRPLPCVVPVSRNFLR